MIHYCSVPLTDKYLNFHRDS